MNLHEPDLMRLCSLSLHPRASTFSTSPPTTSSAVMPLDYARFDHIDSLDDESPSSPSVNNTTIRTAGPPSSSNIPVFGDLREPSPARTPASYKPPSPGKVLATYMPCDRDRKQKRVMGSFQLESLEIEDEHPIWTEGVVSPMSEAIGMEVLMWRCDEREQGSFAVCPIDDLVASSLRGKGERADQYVANVPFFCRAIARSRM
jgi:hypothetical protein